MKVYLKKITDTEAKQEKLHYDFSIIDTTILDSR